MDIEVVEREENLALDREELELKINHTKEETPKRSEVKAKLAAEEGVDEELIIINELHTKYGASETSGYVKIYDNKDSLKKVENEHIIERNTGE